MDGESRLYRIDPSTRASKPVSEVDFTSLGLRERRDIQEWIVENPSILGEELLVIAKEFSGFDRTNERADVICIDQDGNLVVIELKRDDSGSDVHWQAIKYASYFHDASPERIISMLSKHEAISEDDSAQRLRDHMETEDLQHLNGDQRIILVSHRFAPEATSAVLWLNNKATSDYFITCVQLTPFQDTTTNSMYIQASTIIPVPGTEELTIGIGPSERPQGTTRGPAKKRDEISRFLRDVWAKAATELANDVRPTKRSRWAGVERDYRYFNMWYSDPPWKPGRMVYRLVLRQDSEESPYNVTVRYTCDQSNQIKSHESNEEWFSENELEVLQERLMSLEISGSDGVHLSNDGRFMRINIVLENESLGEAFGEELSGSLSQLINAVTPVVNEIVERKNEI